MELGYLAQYALPPDESDACCTLAASRSSAFSRRFGGVAAGAVSLLLHFQGCLFLRVVRRDCPALLLAERGPRLEPLSGDVFVCLVKGFCRAGKRLAWSSLRSRVAVIWSNLPSCWYAFRSGCSSPSSGQTIVCRGENANYVRNAR